MTLGRREEGGGARSAGRAGLPRGEGLSSESSAPSPYPAVVVAMRPPLPIPLVSLAPTDEEVEEGGEGALGLI